MPKPHPAFYGNRIIGAAVTTQAVTIGFTLGSVPIFAGAMSREFGAGSTEFNLGVSIFNLCMSLAMPVAGRFLDRGAIRGVMLFGAAINASCLLLLSQATALWQVALLFGVGCAVGMATLGPVASSTAIANWFDRTRGRALGIANIGAPLGPMLIAPVAAMLIASQGWRITVAGFGVLTALIAVPAILWLLVPSPGSIGQFPDGDAPTAGQQPQAAEMAWSASLLIRQRAFWCLAIGVAPIVAASIVIGANNVPYLVSTGVSEQAASAVVAIMAGGAVAGPLLFGVLADRFNPRSLFWVLYGVLGAGLALLLLEPPYALSLVIFALMGLCGGGMMPLYGSLIARIFGAASFGQVMGLGALVGLPVVFAGPIAFGAARDATGSYSLGFVIFLATFAIAAPLLAALPRGAAERPYTERAPA